MPINKYGNIEVERNTLKYRISMLDLNLDDVNLVEKNLKRKAKSIEEFPYYLLPFQIESINSSIVFYYDMSHYKGFEYLRELEFLDQLKYFSSLIEIAKNESTIVLWNKFNFVIDIEEEEIKTFIFETEDLKVYEEKDPFEGVLELIIITLTNLNQFVGKPPKNSFFDKSEEIIHFAETILKIDNLDDLSHYIKTKRLELEFGNDEEDEEKVQNVLSVETNSKKSGLVNKLGEKYSLKKNNPTKKSSNPKQEKEKKKKVKMIYIMFGLLVVGLLINFLPKTPETAIQLAAEESKKAKNPKEIKQVSPTISSKYDDKLLEAYRNNLSGNLKKSINQLEDIGYQNLSKEDRIIFLNIYEKSGQFHKVIDLDPKRSETIVNDLIALDKIKELKSLKKNMKTKNAYVDFEIAYVNQDWKRIIELKDEVNINGRKENQILESYIALEKYKDAKDFANEVNNPDLLIQLETYKK